MKNLLTFIAGAIVLGGGIFAGHTLYGGQSTQQFGGFNPTGGGTYYLQSPITNTQNTITLSSFKEPGSNIAYTMSYLNSDIEYATINPVGPSNPNGTKSEFVSFTGITQNTNGTALLTGVTRGLERSYPYGASSTLAYSQPGQTQFILSATPQYFNEYALKRSSQVISGQWQFTTLPTSSVVCISSTQFCNKAYIDAGLNQGAATSTFSNLGLVWLAGSNQVGLSTASSTTGAPLVIPNAFATTTPTATCNTWNCIVAAVSGKISQSWLDLTKQFTFTSIFATNASSTNATTTNQTILGNLIANIASFSGNVTFSGTVLGVSAVSSSYTAGQTISASQPVILLPFQSTPVVFDTNLAIAAAGGLNVSANVTVGNNSNRMLIVFTASANSGSFTVSGVTYNGVSMTQLGSSIAIGVNTGKFQEWYLAAPATGTNILTITSSNSGNTVGANVYSYYNVSQTAPEAGGAGGSSGGSASCSVTPLTNGALVVGAIGGINAGTVGGSINTNNILSNTMVKSGDAGAIYPPSAQTITDSGGSSNDACGTFVLAPVNFTSATTTRVYKASAAQPQTASTTIGFSAGASTIGLPISVIFDGLVTGMSGLATSSQYYLSDTPGAISTSPGTTPYKLGKSLGFDRLLLNPNF